MVEIIGKNIFIKGVMFDSKEMTPETVRDNFKKICSFSGRNEYPVRHKARSLIENSKL